MMLEKVAEKYGMVADYYDISGKIYHLSQAIYDEQTNTTIVPVSKCGELIGITRMEGKWQ